MANYDAYARSNYFAVKDPTAFKAWAKSRRLEAWDDANENEETKGSHPTLYSLAVDDGSWPAAVYNSETGEYFTIDLGAELQTHIVDGWAAILMEVGHEKLRLAAYALVVMPDKIEYIDLEAEAMRRATDEGFIATAQD